MTTTAPNPYASACIPLLENHWQPIAVPAGAKYPPPAGFTGADGHDPSHDDVMRWATSPHNVAIRLPSHVIGIDVDAYDDKTGAATLADLEAQHGPLPPTVLVSSRDDGISGIRLFRLPTGIPQEHMRTGWPGIEIIRRNHRYVMAPPSVHPSGRTYLAIDQASGEILAAIPPAEGLPVLPYTWAQACQTGELPAPRMPLPPLSGPADPTAEPCTAMRNGLERALRDLSTGGSRHDTATAAALRLVYIHDLGHHGLDIALGELGSDFVTRISNDPGGIAGRKPRREWDDIVSSARDKALRTPTRGDYGCRCATGSPGTPSPFTPAVNGHSHDLAAAPAVPSSWTPTDLGPYLDGTWERPQPTICEREDGLNLFYPGKTHSIYGEPESGKSWLAQTAAAAQLVAGRPVTYIDFESDAGDIVSRLLALDVTDGQIRTHLTYVRPETAPSNDDPAWLGLLTGRPALVIIDGVTEALVIFGGETKDNDSITSWMNRFPHAISRATRAAVVLIDHVVKSKDDRGRMAIGGQAKLASIDGSAYLVEPRTALAPGKHGEITVRVTKDRPGAIRARSGPFRHTDRTQHTATLHLDATDPHSISTRLAAPTDTGIEGQPARWRPTHLMAKISTLLEADGPQTTKRIEEAVSGKAQHIRTALSELLADGHITRGQGPRNSTVWTHLISFTEGEFTVHDHRPDGQTDDGETSTRRDLD